MKLNIVILAAGQGKRMNSRVSKVLHLLGNKPLLQHVIETACKLNPARLIVVCGHDKSHVQNVINDLFIDNHFIWVIQEQQLGTGHALLQALPFLDQDACTLVLYADVPLISFDTLKDMCLNYNQNLLILTTILENPYGYGRIVRDSNKKIQAIIEEKDLLEMQNTLKEINTGFYIFNNQLLQKYLPILTNDNVQKEYYLTDIIKLAYQDKIDIVSLNIVNNDEILGINNKVQLEFLERKYQLQQADKLLTDGVTLIDKTRIEIRGNVFVGLDCFIDINCIFIGIVKLGNNVYIEAGCILENVEIGNNVHIKAYSILDGAKISDNCIIGPFARIRPTVTIENNVHIGNFVEIKNSSIGSSTKINHLTYVGDACVGKNINIGAGTVTCNYDGVNKNQTIIEDNAFIGSGTMLVAPVTVATGSIIGAGSTITKDTVENELTVARAKQVTIKGWVKKNRKMDN